MNCIKKVDSTRSRAGIPPMPGVLVAAMIVPHMLHGAGRCHQHDCQQKSPSYVGKFKKTAPWSIWGTYHHIYIYVNK